MKRHPSLIPLSREHHGALILARLLQTGAPAYKGLPTDPDGKAAYALDFFRNELEHHFAEEEKIIPLVQGIDPVLDQYMQVMSTEHIAIRRLFAALPESSKLADDLDILGTMMDVHIRREEREIFPLIQEKCSEDVLHEILNLHS